MPVRSVGFPCARHEPGEVREFLPSLFEFLRQFSPERVVLEEGYGRRLGLEPATFQAALPQVTFGSRAEAFAQELVVTLRAPSLDELRSVKRGSALLAMLHFPTRPERVELFAESGAVGVAMDQIVDDLGRRLVENLEAVGNNGVRVAMQVLDRTWPLFGSPERGPLRVTILGAGMVGAHAMRAAARYGDNALRARLREKKVPGVAVTVLDVELSSDAAYLEETLRNSDLLIDSTQRKDASHCVVTNGQLAMLPAHAVIVDLSVDPYDFTHFPPSVRGIEGIPQGNLDQYVFAPDDPAWDRLDVRAPHAVRRTVVSCYSWPGIQPMECMTVYGKQLEPVLRALMEKGTALSTSGGTWGERATARAFHTNWMSGGVS